MIRSTVLALVLVQFPAVVVASTCEPLRERIEAQIRSAGVASFALSVVDAAASAPGKVVGTCDAGAKKLMYVRHDSQAGAPPPPAASAATGAGRATKPAQVITECRDGSQPASGVCK